MANIVYTSYLEHLCSGTINLLSDDLYAMLLSGSYSPNTGDSLVGDITAYEVVDPLASYVQGGAQLSSKTLSVSAGDVVFDAADVTWSSATITASGVAIWRSGASASDHHLVCWTELGNTTSTNGTFQIVWSATDGIFKIGAS